jgi:hypothetical protein
MKHEVPPALRPESGDRLRIIHCFRDPTGGLFRHVRDLCWAQSKAGHLVGIICDSTTGGPLEEQLLAELASALALGITRVPMRRQIGHPISARGACSPARLSPTSSMVTARRAAPMPASPARSCDHPAGASPASIRPMAAATISIGGACASVAARGQLMEADGRSSSWSLRGDAFAAKITGRERGADHSNGLREEEFVPSGGSRRAAVRLSECCAT